MGPRPPVLGDLGESGVLEAILPRAPRSRTFVVGPGDDAAVLAVPDGRVVATTDVLVQDRDFRLDWSSGADVGWKAAVQNLADVAAMGAVPTALLLGLAAPPSTPLAWAVDLVDGLSAACAPLGVGLAGGDLSAADQVVVAVTALGELRGAAAVRRDGARPGHVLAHAGALGLSGAGLDLLAAGIGRLGAALGRAGEGGGSPAPAGAAPEAAVAAALEAHRRPRPPLEAGPAAAGAGASAMLDLSDGLLRDARRLAAASGATLDLWSATLPTGDAVLVGAARALGLDGDAAAQQRLRWVLTGGEDHGLLATFPPDAVLPGAFRAVGRVLAAEGAPVTVDGGEPLWAGEGFDHFE